MNNWDGWGGKEAGNSEVLWALSFPAMMRDCEGERYMYALHRILLLISDLKTSDYIDYCE